MDAIQKQRLSSLLEQQSVAEDDRVFWFSRLGQMSYDVCERIIELFEIFPGEVAHLRSLQEKREKTLGNPEEWKKFIEEEENCLSNLLVTQAQNHGTL